MVAENGSLFERKLVVGPQIVVLIIDLLSCLNGMSMFNMTGPGVHSLPLKQTTLGGITFPFEADSLCSFDFEK